MAGLIVFKGKYKPGAAGYKDALFIEWRVNEICEIEVPISISGLIVDFRELDYVMGDDLDVHAGRVRRYEYPIRIVVTPDRYQSFEGILGAEELRTDIEQAFLEVEEATRTYPHVLKR